MKNIMNTPNEILIRLLKQYPVQSLREHFTIKATGQDHVIRELFEQGITEDKILTFADTNFEFCKQHIYVYEYTLENFPVNLDITGEKPKYKSIVNSKNTLTYFARTSFTIYDTVERKEIELQYLWPIRIQYYYNSKSKTWVLLVKISILEKSLNDIAPGRIIKIGKEVNEKEILEQLNHTFSIEGSALNPIDLTKGIKALTESDVVDFGMAKFRKSKSISTEVMDENYTIKRDNPDAYNLMMHSPIERTTCKFLEKKEEYVQYFRTEPQNGIIVFSLFSPSLNSVDNVVNLIISENF